MKKLLLLCFSLLTASIGLRGQVPDSLPEAPSQNYGLRFGYSLRLPSTNTYRGAEFSLVEAGQEISYGGYLVAKLDRNVHFTPYLGLEHVFWPKSLGYSQDCSQDSFPTFVSTDDSLPGRDMRLFSIAFEPALKFYLPSLGIFLKLQPQFSLNIRTQIENYAYSCDGEFPLGPVQFEETFNSTTSKFNFGIGFGIVKEVRFGGTSGFSIEPGFKTMLTPLFSVADDKPEGPTFSLYPWGFYLNIGFFR